MEIHAFAEAVLFTEDLDLKLSAPEGFSDQHPGRGCAVPDTPGRPSYLALRSEKAVAPSPTFRSIEDERARGLALHSFAHHELQALELMALALLRFPDAPTGFRRGLAKILCDEQRHFRMYQHRAEHWGVGLGQAGVGHFFWDTVANIDNVADFLAALSLTYEQANLDYAAYWADGFNAVDDHDSATVLTEVYEDEIAHVRHGVTWFSRLCGGADFETYRKRLIFPLSPGRGKGPLFNRAGRKRAGMTDAFIDEMEITNVSRGRPPRVFSFDPFVEERAAGRSPKPSVQAISRDLAGLPMFLAHKEDVVIAKRPTVGHLRRLHRLGIGIPQFVGCVEDLGSRLLGEAHPWGKEAQVSAVTKDRAVGWRQLLASEYPSQLWADDASFVAHTLAQAQAKLGQAWIAKAPLSASGQHRVRLEHPGADKWLRSHLAHGPVVLEPWFERLLDVSVQLDVRDEGAQVLGTTRFWTTQAGTFRGGVIGPWGGLVSRSILRALHGGSKKSAINIALADMARFVGQQLHGLGHRGPAGIDAMVVNQDGKLRLLPILEVNPRYTMGRVALQIHRSTGLRGGWFFLSDKDLRQAGFHDRDALCASVLADPMLAFCTEVKHAERVLTVMSLGKSMSEAKARWQALGFDWPD